MTQNQFHYLLEKISSAEFNSDPFSHIEIRDFFSKEHFDLIVSDPQIRLDTQENTKSMIENLLELGYFPCNFAGVTPDIDVYLNCRETDNWPVDKRRTDRIGMVFQLRFIRNYIIKELMDFLRGHDFLKCLCEKFSISENEIKRQFSIQKYLDGYEISPHPDNYKKKLTFLLNINPDDKLSTVNDLHTKLLEFKPEKKFISEYWKYNIDYNRDAVPWDWTVTKKIINRNNTLLMFAPNERTLHAVKLDYDHTKTQRTQIYGNIFDSDTADKIKQKQFPFVKYTSFDIQPDWSTTEYDYIYDKRLVREK